MNLFTFIFWLLFFWPCVNISRYYYQQFLKDIARITYDIKTIDIHRYVMFSVYVIVSILLFINL